MVKSITVQWKLALTFISHMHHLDVSKAFCYARIEGDVYMQSTLDYALPPGHCVKLEKSMYGALHTRGESSNVSI